MEPLFPLRQPLLQTDVAPCDGAAFPLRACLLSGGASRRMGRDKALLPHPAGGTWLEQALRLLLELELPITVFSRHPHHLELTRQLARDLNSEASAGLERPAAACLSAISEPPPWDGPLLALQRLMELHPGQRLLLCPVDMPALRPGELHRLLAAAAPDPGAIHLAHDGEQLQPLLGVYPSDSGHRLSLARAIAAGERRLQSWLTDQVCRTVRLDAKALRNVNRPGDLQPD